MPLHSTPGHTLQWQQFSPKGLKITSNQSALSILLCMGEGFRDNDYAPKTTTKTKFLVFSSSLTQNKTTNPINKAEPRKEEKKKREKSSRLCTDLILANPVMFRLCPCWGRQHNLFCCVQPGWHGCQCRLHLLLEGQGCVQTQLKTHEVDMLRRVHVQIKKIFFVCLLFWGCFYLNILLLQSFVFFNNFWISLIWELWKDK